MKKNKGYLDYYKEWMEKGGMPDYGLCNSLPKKLLKKRLFDLLRPTMLNINDLKEEGLPTMFWGSGSMKYRLHDLSPLRETILILAAILNDEL